MNRVRPEPWVPTYQFTPQASKNNAFSWADGTPSIFRTRVFAIDDSGNATRASNEYEQRTGKSRGTVMGISPTADRLTEEFTRQKMSRRRIPHHNTVG